MMNSVTVSAELGLSLVVPEHGAVPLVASIDFRADDPYAVRMAFHVGPFGEARFAAPLAAIADFLKSTYQIIPAGAESDFIDVDGELDELLWQA